MSREGAEPELVVVSTQEREPEALVVTPGAGGFPLLGAIAIGHRRTPISPWMCLAPGKSGQGVTAAQSSRTRMLPQESQPNLGIAGTEREAKASSRVRF